MTAQRRLSSIIYRYYLFGFLRSFALFSGVLVPFFTDWGHINLAQVQFLQAWFMLWIFLLEVPTGAIADYFGRKFSISLGIVVAGIGIAIYGTVPRFEVFLIGEFLFALCNALISGADDALIYDTLKEYGREDESKKVFSREHSIRLVGNFIAAPIGSLLGFHFGLNAPVFLSAIPFFLAGLVALSLPEPIRFTEVKETTRYLVIARDGLKFFLTHKTLRLLALDTVLVASSAYFLLWFYQPLLRNSGVPILYFGYFHAFLVLCEIAIASNFIRLEKLLGGARKFLSFSALVTALSFILVAFIPNIYTIITLLIFAGGFGLTRMELMNSYMNKFIPSEQRATVLSSISMMRRLALVILNPIIGLTADFSLSIALWVVGALALAVFFFSPVEQEMLDTKDQ